MNERCISCWISIGSVRSCSPEWGPVTTSALRISRNRHADGGHIHMWMITVHSSGHALFAATGPTYWAHRVAQLSIGAGCCSRDGHTGFPCHSQVQEANVLRVPGDECPTGLDVLTHQHREQ